MQKGTERVIKKIQAKKVRRRKMRRRRNATELCLLLCIIGSLLLLAMHIY